MLVGMETGAAIRDISKEGPQKSKDRNTIGSSCITRVCPQRDVKSLQADTRTSLHYS